MGDEEMVLNTINYDKAAYDANAAQYGALPLKTQIQVASCSNTLCRSCRWLHPLACSKL